MTCLSPQARWVGVQLQSVRLALFWLPCLLVSWLLKWRTEEDRMKKREEDHMNVLPHSLWSPVPQPAYLCGLTGGDSECWTCLVPARGLRSGSESPRIGGVCRAHLAPEMCWFFYLLRKLLIERESQGPVLPASQSPGGIGPAVFPGE